MATEKLYKVYRYWIYLDPDPKPWSYIGCTSKSLGKRADWRTGAGYFPCQKFWAAIETYGFPAFEREILEDGLTEEEAFEKEKLYIQKFNSIEHGWNTSTGGKSGASGHKASAETRRKRSIASTANWSSEEFHRKMTINRSDLKAVLQFTTDGQYIAEYISIREASRITGVRAIGICLACQGKRKTAGNSKWKYKDTN